MCIRDRQVILVGDGIARASGLEKCMAGELLQFDNGEYGMAQNLEENTVSIVLLGYVSRLYKQSICVSGTHEMCIRDRTVAALSISVSQSNTMLSSGKKNEHRITGWNLSLIHICRSRTGRGA